jgi:outer membrane protein
MRRASVLSILLATIAALSPVTVSAQSLTDAFVLAYKNNPTILAQRARLRSIDEGVPQAVSGWRPDVRFTTNVAKLRRRTNSTGGFGSGDDTRTTYSGGFRVTQNVYAGGRTESEIRQAKHKVSAERARLMTTEQQVLLDAATSYMNVFREEAVLRLNINNEQVLSRQLQATRDRFNVGEVTRTDVAQAESRLARATAVRIQAEGDLEVSRAFYEQIVGVKPAAVPNPGYPSALPAEIGQAVDLARDGNPAVISAKFDERAAREFIGTVKAELLPSVDLVGAASRSRNEGTPDRTVDDITITAELTVPIYQQGAVSSRIREAIQLASENRLQVDEARRAAIEDAASGFEQLLTARASIRSREAEVRAAKIALEGVEQEAAVGSRTVLDVLDAEQELLDAQVSLVLDQRDAIVTSYGLLAAVGRLTARELALPVNMYDQKAHYLKVRDKLWGYQDEPAKQAKPRLAKQQAPKK